MFKIIIWILFQVFLANKKHSLYRNKDILNTAPRYWINKIWRFWRFSVKDPSITKCSLTKILFLFKYEWFFRCMLILFALYYTFPIQTHGGSSRMENKYYSSVKVMHNSSVCFHLFWLHFLFLLRPYVVRICKALLIDLIG